MEATRAGMGCGSCKSWSSSWWSGPAAAGRRGSDRPLLRARHPAGQAGAGRARSASARLKSVSAVFATSPAARRIAASKPGLASLLKTLWHGEYDDERDARFINDRVHANIQKDGTFSVVPQMPGGVTHAGRAAAHRRRGRQVPRAAGEADRRPAHRSARASRRKTCPASGSDLGMPAGYAYGKSYRTCKSCVGTDFCRYGLGDSIGLAMKIEKRFQGLEAPRKMKLATAGCPRNCSEAHGEGRRRGGGRRRQVGDLRRRRGRRARPQGRPAVRRRHARRRAAVHGPLHPVLPREREVSGADARLRRAAGDRQNPGGGRRRQ